MKVKKEKDNSYYMEEILLKKVENGQTKYLIKWEGFSHAENTWEPKSNLHAAEVQAFEDKLAKEAEQFAERDGSSSDDDAKPVEVEGIQKEANNKIKFLIGFSDGTFKLVKRKTAHKRYPQLVIDFYEKRISFPM